jgi:hypothetical protein
MERMDCCPPETWHSLEKAQPIKFFIALQVEKTLEP